MSWDLLVSRADLTETTVRETEPPALTEGQALLRVDRVGVTANNVTYALFGDAMHYWDFFPAEPGWGRVPLWGFADVEQSTVEGVRGRYAGVRVPTHQQPPCRRAWQGRRAQLPGRLRASLAAALAVQPVHDGRRRFVVRRGPRGPADPVPPAVHDQLHAGGLPHRQRPVRRDARGALERVQQDVVRHCSSARRQGDPDRADQRRQPRVHGVARLLRAGPDLRRPGLAARVTVGLRRRRG